MHATNGHGAHPALVCHEERGPSVLWKYKSTHRPLQKYVTPISQPAWLGVGIEDPSGVVETKVHSWGTLEKISTYISPLINICTCTVALFVRLFVFLSLQRINIPHDIQHEHEQNVPSQHVAPCNGNEGYSLPSRAHIATGDTYPGGGDGRISNAIAFEDPTYSRNDGGKGTHCKSC